MTHTNKTKEFQAATRNPQTNLIVTHNVAEQDADVNTATCPEYIPDWLSILAVTVVFIPILIGVMFFP